MAEIAVGFLLENLTQLLRYNAEVIGEESEVVESLLQDLMVFKGIMKDFTEQRFKSHTLQELMKSIKSVVEEAEDAIDQLVSEKATFQSKTVWSKAIHSLAHRSTIKRLVHSIHSIRRRASSIYTEKQFGFHALSSEPQMLTTSLKPPSVEQDDVVGFDEEAKILIGRLINSDNEHLDIITIVGMAGLGKTTLARKVYNDRQIEYEFFNRVWVFISQNYSKRQVFLKILRQFTFTVMDDSDKSDEVLATEIRQHLERGKYLIVMDDVWTNEAWNDLKGIFPDKNNGSRILMTSRHSHVGKYANPGEKPHYLKSLTANESWELLEKRVFGKRKCPHGEVEKQGRLIADSCQGLPLAIVVIAGVILNNPDSSEWWKQVGKNVKTFIVEKQEEVLALSYDHLPYYLKACFLYLGVFPEDYEIPVSKLILLWMAEGFIEQKGGQSLEDIASSYVEELANRSLLMVAQRKPNGEIKTCCVQRILHKFCKQESESQMFYQVIEDVDTYATVQKYQRVCIHSDVERYLFSKPRGERVRSFLCFAPANTTTLLQAAQISVIPKDFRLLRVLEIRSITLEIFPKDLLLLALLRYIAISCNIKVLPSSISRLWNMQTMIIMTSSTRLQLKEDVWKMYQLRHLHTNASALLPPPPSNIPTNKESLQSLSRVSPESCTKPLFTRTPNIKKLGIQGKVAKLLNTSFDSIGSLQHLTNLKIFNDDINTDSSSEDKILRLPPAYKFPPKLQKLTLSETSLPWEEMKVLEKLEMLEELKLKDNAFRGVYWESSQREFPSLKLLHIGKTDLTTWKASELSFPSLTHLVLEHCDKLQEVPPRLADIASFKLLKLYHVNRDAAKSARAIHEKKSLNNGTSPAFKLDIYTRDD